MTLNDYNVKRMNMYNVIDPDGTMSANGQPQVQKIDITAEQNKLRAENEQLKRKIALLSKVIPWNG